MKKTLWVWCMAFVAMIGSITHAEMSQVPLVQAGSSVPPNLMFTIDDSGSMNFECIPDSLCYDGSNDEVDVMPWGLSLIHI